MTEKEKLRNERLTELCKHHKKWLKIAKVYGAGEYSEDIVQDTYLYLIPYLDNAFKGGKLNAGYVFFAVRSVLINWQKRENKLKPLYIDEVFNLKDDEDGSSYLGIPDDSEEILEDLNALEDFLTLLDDTLAGWYWYDRQVFNLYRNTDLSIRGISEKTGIGTASIFNTLKKCKNKVFSELREDYEDLVNKDYELILKKKKNV